MKKISNDNHMGAYEMPGGKGTSKPVTMEKSMPVNVNPHHKAAPMSPEKGGTGRGKTGAC